MENYTSSASYGGINDYSSIFSPDRYLFSSLSPSPCAYPDVPMAVDLAPFQDIIDRRNWCLSQLRSTAKEAEALREENINLHMMNIELNRQLELMRQDLLGNYFGPPPLSSTVASNFRRMMIGEKAAAAAAAAGRCPWNEERAEAVKVVNGPVERMGEDRVKLPKSISIRSSGYLKTVQGGGTSATEGRVRVPNRVKAEAEAKRVYVRGGKKEEEPLELHVFNQGMTKTELCNKWEQTGACPYEEHCQFAHGIAELRPVLRHPRYKTEVCRMILAGDHCPYGHRCHFRHSLTDEEKKLMGQQQMKARRSLKL